MRTTYQQAVQTDIGVINLPSSSSTTITSIAPLNVAGLMEFQVFETDPLMLLTYCILL